MPNFSDTIFWSFNFGSSWMPIPVSNGLNKGMAFFQKCKENIFQKSLFILSRKIHKKANGKFYHSMGSSLSIGSLWTAMTVVGRGILCPELSLMELEQKTALFKRKLNKIPQEVSFAAKLCLIVLIQYFEVSIFVGYKCQFLSQLV